MTDVDWIGTLVAFGILFAVVGGLIFVIETTDDTEYLGEKDGADWYLTTVSIDHADDKMKDIINKGGTILSVSTNSYYARITWCI